MNKCKNCNKETKNPSYCSSKCSALKTTKGRKHTKETREKISKSLGGSGNLSENKKCLNCNSEINYRKLYCNNKCQQEFKYKENIKEWLKNPEFGTTDKYKTYKSFVKKWLIEIYGEKCCKCGWNEKNPVINKTPIEVDHIDGNYSNNNPNNLRLLCPNCHSLTPTFRALNKGNGNPIALENMKKHIKIKINGR